MTKPELASRRSVGLAFRIGRVGGLTIGIRKWKFGIGNWELGIRDVQLGITKGCAIEDEPS